MAVWLAPRRFLLFFVSLSGGKVEEREEREISLDKKKASGEKPSRKISH